MGYIRGDIRGLYGLQYTLCCIYVVELEWHDFSSKKRKHFETNLKIISKKSFVPLTLNIQM